MKKIFLGNGNYTIVDNDDYDKFNKFKWYLNGSGSVIGRMKRGAGKLFHLHRIIIDAPPDMQVDHINRNRLDNRKVNLRLATQLENNWNQAAQKNCKTGVKGVYWRPERKRWRAVFRYKGKLIIDKMYKNFDDAVNIRTKTAIEFQKEFAFESNPL